MSKKKDNKIAQFFRCSESIVTMIDEYCEKEGKVKGAVIEKAIQEYVEKNS